MKVAVVGCGAMGSVYAALLAAAGHDVWAIDTWAAHVEAIRSRGLRLEGASGDRTVRLQASTQTADAGPCDLVVVATKVMHTAQAASALPPLMGEDTVVVSIQNGIGGPAAVAAVVGEARVVVGVVGGFGATIRALGHAHHAGWELLLLGECAGAVTPRLEALAALWREAGFQVRCRDDIDQLVWEKLVCNVAFSGPCALTESLIGEVIGDADLWSLASGCVEEAFAVARARGTRLGFDDPVAHVRAFGLRFVDSRPSMLLDHMARRLSEVDAINGAIAPAALAVGLTAPCNEAVAALIRARERRLGLRP